MPFIRIDAVAGRSWRNVTELLGATQRVVASAFNVPICDQCQAYQEQPAARLFRKAKSLGVKPSRNTLLFTVVSTPRSLEKQQQFYADLCEELRHHCGIVSTDVVVSVLSRPMPTDDLSMGMSEPLRGIGQGDRGTTAFTERRSRNNLKNHKQTNKRKTYDQQ